MQAPTILSALGAATAANVRMQTGRSDTYNDVVESVQTPVPSSTTLLRASLIFDQ